MSTSSGALSSPRCASTNACRAYSVSIPRTFAPCPLQEHFPGAHLKGGEPVESLFPNQKSRLPACGLRQARRMFRQIMAGLEEALAMRACGYIVGWGSYFGFCMFVLQQLGFDIVGWEQREEAGRPPCVVQQEEDQTRLIVRELGTKDLLRRVHVARFTPPKSRTETSSSALSALGASRSLVMSRCSFGSRVAAPLKKGMREYPR